MDNVLSRPTATGGQQQLNLQSGGGILLSSVSISRRWRHSAPPARGCACASRNIIYVLLERFKLLSDLSDFYMIYTCVIRDNVCNKV